MKKRKKKTILLKLKVKILHTYITPLEISSEKFHHPSHMRRGARYGIYPCIVRGESNAGRIKNLDIFLMSFSVFCVDLI